MQTNEEDIGIGEVEETLEVEQSGPTDEQLLEEAKNGWKTWEGRLRTEQENKTRAFDALDAQYASQGYRVNRDSGQLEAIANQTGGYQTTNQQYTQPIEDDEVIFDSVTDAAVEARIARGVQQGVATAINGLMPLLGNLTQSSISQQVDDWKDIGPEVTARLQTQYGMTLVQAQAQVPQLIEDLSLAARQRRGVSTAVIPKPTTIDPALVEQERRRLAAIGGAASIGGSSAPSQVQSVDMTDEDRKVAAELGMTDEQYMALGNGASIGGGR